MSSPEANENKQWNPEAAVPLFSELAQMQLQSGIFAGYMQAAERLIEDDPEMAVDMSAVLYAELPLGVAIAPDLDERDNRSELYLVKVNPVDGRWDHRSLLNVGYSIDEESGSIGLDAPESEPIFTAEQAALMREQLKLQLESGLQIELP